MNRLHNPLLDSFGETLKNAVAPAPPIAGAPPATASHVPGIGRPSTDFQAVRDGRRSTLLSYLVDLSTARTIAAGTALTLPLAGNVFMSDPLFDLTGVSQAGVARVHFQDTTIGAQAQGTYVTMLPSSIYKVTATQLLIENYAQAGKFLLLVYGVDVDLVAGSSQQVQATIINSVTVTPGGAAHTSAKVTVGVASTLVRAAVATPKMLSIQVPPTAANPVWVRGDGAAAVADATSTRVDPGEMWVPIVPPIGIVNAIAAAPTDVNLITA